MSSLNDYKRIQNNKKDNSDINNTTNLKTFKTDVDNIGSKLKELCASIPDTGKYMQEELIKLIPLDKNRKGKFSKLRNYLEYPKTQSIVLVNDIPKIPSGALIHGNDNIGVYINNTHSNLCVLDIDGAKGKLNKTDNVKLVNYLKDLLTKIDVPFIIQKTQSQCYHLLYAGKNNFSFKGFKYPQDFFIEELRGQDLETSTIEVLNNNLVPLAPTKTKTGEYKLLETGYTWGQIFNNPCENMFDKIKTVFTNEGFTYEAPVEAKVNNTGKYDLYNELVTLTTEEIEKVVEACKELLIIAHTKNCKYYVSLAIGGLFSRNIKYESAETITNKIAIECDELFNNTTDFIKTVLNNYDRNNVKKSGIPTIKNLLTVDLHDVKDKEQRKAISNTNWEAKKNINILSNIILKEIPHGYLILEDKGENGSDGVDNDKINNTINSAVARLRKDETGESNLVQYTNEEILLFCFDKIEIIDGFNPKTQQLEDDKPTKYNFTIKSNRFKETTKKYLNITLNEFIYKIDNLDLNVYNGDLKLLLKQIINKYNSNKNVRTILKPYYEGVYVYKDQIMFNTPYINNNGDIKEGLDVFGYMLEHIFKNDSQYITIFNMILLSMLNSVFKGLSLANGLNKALILAGDGQTLKTFCVLTAKSFFIKNFDMLESTGGDTIPAIHRQLNRDVVPLDIHDCKLNPADDTFKQLIKSMLFGWEANITSSGQYGNDLNVRDSYRTLITTLNDNPQTFDIEVDDGEDRRLIIFYFGSSYKVTKEQNKAIKKVLSMDSNNRPYKIINKISSIGYEFLKFVKETIKPYELSTDLIEEITDNGGVTNGEGYGLILNFWTHINNITDNKYSDICNKMSIPFNFYTDYIADKTTDTLNCLRKDFKEYTDSTLYNEPTLIDEWIKNSPLFIEPKDKNGNYGDLIAVEKPYFKSITKNIITHKNTDYLFKKLFEDSNIDLKEINNIKGQTTASEDSVFYQRYINDFKKGAVICLIKREWVNEYML